MFQNSDYKKVPFFMPQSLYIGLISLVFELNL